MQTMARIDFSIPCAACDADLAGAELDANCPACGWPVAATIRIDALDPATGLVCEDVRCRTCDYNLRALPLDGCCPECAAPVVDSLRANVLAYADSHWRRNVARGVNACLIAVIGLPVGWLLTTFAANLLFGRLQSLVTLCSVYGWLLLLVGAYGMIKIATHDPTDPRAPDSPWPRRIALLFPVIGLPGIFILLIADLTSSFFLFAPGMFSVWMPLITLSLPAGSAAALLLLRHQAGRVRRPKLLRHSTALARLFGILTLLFAIMFVLQSRLTTVVALEFLQMIGIARNGLGIVTDVWFVACDFFAIYVLLRYRRIFADARAQTGTMVR